ncbi:unnamed protein product, partial [Mesorhabditis spiculigera]
MVQILVAKLHHEPGTSQSGTMSQVISTTAERVTIGEAGNRASDLVELLGATEALRRLLKWPEYCDEDIIIRSDSLNLVKRLNGCAGGYEAEMATLRSIAEQFPGGVKFQHVFAHNGDPGNEKADTMARHAMRTGIKYREPPAIVGKTMKPKRKSTTASTYSALSRLSTANAFDPKSRR